MSAVHAAPAIWCDNCDQPCRPHFILGQCQECGGYICKSCYPYHLCMKRDRSEVRKMKPEYVTYDVNVNKSV